MKKFRYIDGCTVTNITVNEKYLEDLTNKEKIEAIKILINYVFEQDDCNEKDELLRNIFEMLFPYICNFEKTLEYDKESKWGGEIELFGYKDKDDYLLMFDCEFGTDPVIVINEDAWKYVDIDKKKKIFHKIIEKSADNCYLNNCFMEILEGYGKHKYLYHCDQCGDSVREWTLII